jgi:transposase-like protein
MLGKFQGLYDLFDAFPDEQSCLDHLRAIRWRDGEFCPHCGGTRICHFSDRKTFKCGDCRQRFSIKVGTIFHDTKLPLRKWFMAIWMITNHKKGVASTTLARDLKITQKSAWHVLHRLRHAARTRSFNAPLSGTVASDETCVGGKEKNKHADKRQPGSQGGANKAVVLGVLKRDGEFRAEVVADTSAKSVQGMIRKNVQPGSLVITDEHRACKGPGKDYAHLCVNHSAGLCAVGGVHSNSIESVWALLKRQIIGIHHFVSTRHLSRYVDEMTWRFNRRDMDASDRMNDIFADVEGRMPWQVLTA